MINKELEAVAQHDGRHYSRQLRAPGCQPGCHPSCQRQLGNLRCPGEKYFVEQRQSIDPLFELPGVVGTGIGHAAGDRPHSAGVLERPHGVCGVGVECQFSAGKVGGKPVQQRHEVILCEEEDEPVGDDHRRPVCGDVVQPVRISQVRADVVGIGGLWQQFSPEGDHLGKVDVIPVDGGRRVDPEILPSRPAPRSSTTASG